MKSGATDPNISVRAWERHQAKIYNATFLSCHSFLHSIALPENSVGTEVAKFCTDAIDPLEHAIFKTGIENEQKNQLRIGMRKSIFMFDKFISELFRGAFDETIQQMDAEDGVKFTTGAELRVTNRTTAEQDIFAQQKLEMEQDNNANRFRYEPAIAVPPEDEDEEKDEKDEAEEEPTVEMRMSDKEKKITARRAKHCDDVKPEYMNTVEMPQDIESWKTLFKTHYLSDIVVVGGPFFGLSAAFLHFLFLHVCVCVCVCVCV